jgi:hypothetical protein
MEFLQYIFRFLYRVRWWLVIAPLLVALVVILGTRDLERSYPVDMTIYTGIVSGYAHGDWGYRRTKFHGGE